MLTIALDVSAFRAAATAAIGDLARGCRDAVDASGKSGKATARVLAPHRSYALRDSIESRVTASGASGADGELEATAEHASWMRDGTRAHAIFPKRKKFLRFQAGGGTVFSRGVSHPGTKPFDYWKRGIEAAEITLSRQCNDVVGDVCARMSR